MTMNPMTMHVSPPTAVHPMVPCRCIGGVRPTFLVHLPYGLDNCNFPSGNGFGYLEDDDDLHFSRSRLPHGVKFELHTLPVNARLIGDGDGMIVHVDTADLSEAALLPQEVKELVIQRHWARMDKNYPLADLLHEDIIRAGYRMIKGQFKEDILVKEYRIRLRGIDEPEMNMEWGMEAKEALISFIQNKPLTIQVYGQDPYQRWVGDVYVENEFVQEKMLKNGHAWHYAFFDQRPQFAEWQKEAQVCRRGLWVSENPIAPWDFKREERRRKKRELLSVMEHRSALI